MPTDDQLIREVLARYVRHADERNAAGWGALFAEDARFTPRSGPEYRGRAAIEAWFVELFKDGGPSATSLHLCGNQEIAVSGDTAEATSDVLVLHRDPGQPWVIHQVNRYFDRFVRTDGGWLFAERRIVGR